MSIHPHDLALQLFDLQKREHEGAGVPAVREIIEALREERMDDARRLADWGWHEIRHYRGIASLLERELF